MAKKAYIYSDFSAKDALSLTIDGQKFEVAQFSSSWAENEIPSAVCMLAIGRNVQGGAKAAVHTQGATLKIMADAEVTFKPQKEYSQDKQWPGSGLIFKGYFVGFTYRKIGGKIYATANLIHWLAALGFSSCLTATGHVANPTQMNAAAVTATPSNAGGGQGDYVSQLTGAHIVGDAVLADVWKSMSKIFCELAKIEALPVSTEGECSGDGDAKKNDAALSALQKIEGSDCATVAKKWYKELAIEADELGGLLADAIAESLGTETIEAYSTQSFWDKLIGQFCPSYGMSLVPRVETAVVVADTPAYSGGSWKTLDPDEYDSHDMSANLERPIQAVGVIAGWESQTMAGQEEANAPSAIVGGCFAADAIKPGDGIRVYIAPPPWLRVLRSQAAYAGASGGVKTEDPTKTATTPDASAPDPAKPKPSSTGESAKSLYDKYAHDYYVGQMLRGRGGAVSGKLRFDIAPGSIITLKASTDKIIGGEDDLAETIIACVQRVTVTINAEASMAGTSFQLSHVRSEQENGKPRTSVDAHPIFGKNVVIGCPLSDTFNI